MSREAINSRPASRVLEFSDYVGLLRAQFPDLAKEFAGYHGIEAVLQWMQTSGRVNAAIDMVAQDEFNYDFLIELEPGGRWLAWGVT